MAEVFRQLIDWVAQNPGWAHLAVFIISFAESMAVVGLLVPGVVTMFGIGALIAADALEFWPVLLWAVAGAVMGDGASYWLGYHFRDRLTQVWPFTRYPESLAAGVRFFEKYGGKSVAFGRFVGPVRAVIPLVAGMLAMRPSRFLVANVLSALAWAPAYLLPGIVFGASLELAAEVAFHLVVLLIATVALVWLVVWLVQQVFLLLSPHANAWLQALLRWSEVHPKLGEIAAALADPNHPDGRSLAVLATLLLLTTAVFVAVAGAVVSGGFSPAVDERVFETLQSLRTPFGDHVMVALSRFADTSVLLPVCVVLGVYLWGREHRRTGLYWVAAVAFGFLVPLVLKPLFQVPRPDIGIEDLSSWAFPSGHVLRASAVFGFLSVVISRGVSENWRWLPYSLAGALITLVGLSRLYLGAHWLSDVVGSLALGLAWVSALGLAYRRHTQLNSPWRSLSVAALAAVMVAFGAQTLWSQETDVRRYQAVTPISKIDADQWRQALWRTLPGWRDDLREQRNQPLGLQYSGEPEQLGRLLEETGWEPAPMLDWESSLKLLSPDLPLQQLPVLPHVHDGRHGAFVWVKNLPEGGRLVLRLWDSGYRLDPEQKPVWLGSVSDQIKLTPLGLLAVPATSPRFHEAYERLLEDLAPARPIQPDPTRDLMLVEL